MNAGESFSLFTLFKMGGVFMWPLLLFSVATLTLIVERVIYICCHNLKVEDLAANLNLYIREHNTKGALEYLKKNSIRRPAARILLTLTENMNLPTASLEKSVEAEASSCIISLESGFDFLVALGSLAPLTGFLGTVSGMIGAFKSIAEATDVNAQIVANGIYEALITTVYGLIIAIVAMIGHSLLSHSIDKFSANIEKYCSTLITSIETIKHENENKNV
ncbi:hypothetical protein FACS1894190_08860 [Spirochaetia bacterium]|nr:hypothetical protein FACS1894190_08860 [Spirochaetia bacterium]